MCKQHYRCPALFILTAFLGTTATIAAQVPFALLHSLFDPGTNTQAGVQQSGYIVAVDRNIVVAGAPFEDAGAEDSGVVRVYDARSGALMHTLINPNPATEAYFGQKLAISGTKVVVGTSQYDPNTGNALNAYVFDLASATPTEPVARLINPSLSGSRNSIAAVGISGTIVVAGALADDTGAFYAGSAYVYDLASATPCTPAFTLTNPSPAELDDFGVSVAIAGTRVVVGATGDDTGAINAGSVYVFELAGSRPTVPFITLTNPSPTEGGYFG